MGSGAPEQPSALELTNVRPRANTEPARSDGGRDHRFGTLAMTPAARTPDDHAPPGRCKSTLYHASRTPERRLASKQIRVAVVTRASYMRRA